MKRLFKRYCLLLLLPAFLHFFASCSNNTTGPRSLDLSGKWKIIVSDNDKIANPGYDDSKSDEIAIPGTWNYILNKNENMAATIWLRKKIVISKEFTDSQFILSLGTIPIADKAYINGVEIGSTGEFPSAGNPLDYGLAWFEERNYIFSSRFITYDSENIIAIKVFSHFVCGIKDNPKIFTISDWRKQSRLKELLPTAHNLNLLIIAIIPFLFLFIIIKGIQKNTVFYYSIAAAGLYFMILLQFLGIPRYNDGLYIFKMWIVLHIAIDFSILLIVKEFMEIKIKWVMPIFISLLISVIIFIIMAPTSKFYAGYPIHAGYLLIIIYILYIHYMFITAMIKDPRRYWFLSILALFLFISIANHLYFLISSQLYKISFSVYYRMPSLILGAVILLLIDLKNSQKENESLSRTLIRKTQQLKQIKNRLSGVQFKADPRDTIHEVIDYLDNNFFEAYNRKDLAKKFNLNEDYLVQIFKKTTSLTISRYLNEKRIEAAKQLLHETEGQIIEIAFHVGYDNLSYFYRIFKMNTGLTPKEYRKHMKATVPVEISQS